MPKLKSFRVAGHFYTGLYEFDSKLAYVSLADAQKFLAFVTGYLSHIGLDTWAEQYLHSDFPAAARQGLPAAWYPAVTASWLKL